MSIYFMQLSADIQEFIQKLNDASAKDLQYRDNWDPVQIAQTLRIKPPQFQREFERAARQTYKVALDTRTLQVAQELFVSNQRMSADVMAQQVGLEKKALALIFTTYAECNIDQYRSSILKSTGKASKPRAELG